MTSDSDSKRSTSQRARGKAGGPIIDLEASEVKAETPADEPAAEAPTPDVAMPEPSTLENAATDASTAEVAADAPADEAAPAPAASDGAVEADTTALLSEVPPSGQGGGEATAAGNGFVALVAAALLGGVVALGGGGGVLHYTGLLSVAPAASGPDAIAALRTEVSGLATKLAALPPPVDVGDLSARVDTIETVLRDVGAAAPGASDAALTALNDEVGALSRQVSALATVDPAAAKATAATVASLAERQKAIETSLAALMAAREQLGADNRQAVDRLTQIEQRLNAAPKGGEIAALAMAATSLAGKVDAGLPFAVDLKLVDSAAPGLDGLEALRPLAARGVPTLDQLLTGMPVDAMMAHRPPDVRAGWLEGLTSSAKSLVNYRDTDPASGDPASRAIEAMRTALKTGDAGAALTAAGQLPDWARGVAGDWLAGLGDRVAADKAIATLTGRLVDRLNATATRP
jgi:hypothetical protein